MRSMNESDMARQVMNPYEHAYLAKYHSIFGQQLMLSGRRVNEGDQREDPDPLRKGALLKDVLNQKKRRTEDEKDGTYGEDQQPKKPPKAKKPVAHDVVDNRTAKTRPTGHFEAALAAKNTQITDLMGAVNKLLEHANANPASHGGPAVGSVSHIWPNMHDYWPIMYVRRPPQQSPVWQVAAVVPPSTIKQNPHKPGIAAGCTKKTAVEVAHNQGEKIATWHARSHRPYLANHCLIFGQMCSSPVGNHPCLWAGTETRCARFLARRAACSVRSARWITCSELAWRRRRQRSSRTRRAVGKQRGSRTRMLGSKTPVGSNP